MVERERAKVNEREAQKGGVEKGKTREKGRMEAKAKEATATREETMQQVYDLTNESPSPINLACTLRFRSFAIIFRCVLGLELANNCRHAEGAISVG